MKIFSYLYDKTIQWASNKKAPYYLAGVAFAESSFFPIPPDVMLISMGLAIPKKSWYFAAITTLFSVLGGLFGYLIGHFFIDYIRPFINASSYAQDFLKVEDWFAHYGTIIVFVAAFSPFPYKLFTIAAGGLSVPLAPFILGSFLGRGMRFFLVSTLMYYSGARLHTQLRRYVEWVGWLFIILIALIILVKCLL